MNQPSHSQAKIVLICLSSRLVVFLAQLASNLALPDHKSKDAFVSPSVSKFSRSALDKLVQDYIFSGLNHWDGQWFLSIAVAGSYEDEQKLVFLPVFPLCIHFVSKFISFLSFGLLNPVSAVMVASVLVNTLAFCLAGLALYRLTALIFWRLGHSFAEETILWFAYNPASIFFTATYSESIYSAFTFMGLAALYSKQHFLSSILFALSTLTRSNGLLNAGYLLFHLLLFIIAQFTSQRGRLIDTSVKFVIYILGIIISIGPFYWYQRKYIPSKFCPGSSFCSSLPQASNGSVSNSFFPYVFLQNHYWNQGLLRYFEMKQLPNFILASPIIILITVISIRYFKSIIATNVAKQCRCSLFDLNQNHQKHLLPFVLHTLALALVSLLFLHVQVATRLICSSSPLIYWYASSLESASKVHRLTKLYFTSYFFIGVAAFANSLPWT